MKRSAFLFFSLPFSLLASLHVPAQVQPYTKAIPSFATGYYDGVDGLTASITGGRTRMIYQMWYRGDTAPGRPAVLTAIGERPMQGLTVAGNPADLEIVLSSTTATATTLSTTFVNNLGNDATIFFSQKIYNMPTLTNHTDPNQPVVWIVGDRPFAFIQGPHFIVQTTVRTEATARNTGHRPQALTMRTSTSGHARSDPGCGGGLTASYTSPNYSLSLTGAIPNGPAIFMLALRNVALGGAIPLPIDLSPLGMTGCTLAVDPLVNVALAADGGGNAVLSVPFPMPAEGVFVHAQVLHASTANALGFATSNVAHSLIGNVNLMAYVYNFSDITPVATNGPFTTVRGPVLLYRP